MHWWGISCEEVGVSMYIEVSGTHQIQLNPPEGLTDTCQCQAASSANRASPHDLLQVWMLTGDKLETATCTAKNAHLVTRSQDIHIFRLVRLCLPHPGAALSPCGVWMNMGLVELLTEPLRHPLGLG